jgi:CBS domain-containing protein
MFQCQLWNGLSNLWVVYVADAQQPDNANSNTKIGGSKAHRKGLLLQPPFSRRFVGDIERRQLMKAKEAMHKGVEWVSPDTPLIAIAKKMLEQDIGAVPIGENDRLIGMVTDRDIALRAVANGKDVSRLTARDVMTEGIVWCRDIDEVNQAADVMQTRQVRRLPVIDQNKRMIGILSLGDISHSASKRTAAEVARGVSAHHA